MFIQNLSLLCSKFHVEHYKTLTLQQILKKLHDTLTSIATKYEKFANFFRSILCCCIPQPFPDSDFTYANGYRIICGGQNLEEEES